MSPTSPKDADGLRALSAEGIGSIAPARVHVVDIRLRLIVKQTNDHTVRTIRIAAPQVLMLEAAASLSVPEQTNPRVLLVTDDPVLYLPESG
jgi:hypothetical protein